MTEATTREPARPATRAGRAIAALSDGMGTLAALSLVALLLLVGAEIVLRPLGHSLLVTDEMGAYLNAAIVFLGLAHTLRHGGFIRMEVLYDRLGPRTRRAATWAFLLASLLFAGLLTWLAWKHVAYAFSRDTRAISILATPEWIPQSLMLLGLAALVLQLLAFALERARNVP